MKMEGGISLPKPFFDSALSTFPNRIRGHATAIVRDLDFVLRLKIGLSTTSHGSPSIGIISLASTIHFFINVGEDCLLRYQARGEIG